MYLKILHTYILKCTAYSDERSWNKRQHFTFILKVSMALPFWSSVEDCSTGVAHSLSETPIIVRHGTIKFLQLLTGKSHEVHCTHTPESCTATCIWLETNTGNKCKDQSRLVWQLNYVLFIHPFQKNYQLLIKLFMIWHRNSGHPIRYYCRCQCLCWSHMVIVRLVLQPPLCGIGCWQILEMRHLFNILKVAFTDKL